MKVIRQAIVLAAGKGERLKPLTNELPKPLVPIRGISPLERILELLLSQGIDKIVINTHYLPHKIEAFLAHYSDKEKITLSHEPEILGSGGGVLNATRLLPFPAEDFFVVNADCYFDCSSQNVFQEIETFWLERKSNHKGVLVLIAPKKVIAKEIPKGDFAYIDKESHIKHYQFLKIPSPLYVFGGIQILNITFFEGCQSGLNFGIQDLWYKETEKKQLLGYCADITWGDMGTPQDLEAVENYVKMFPIKIN